MEVKIVLDEGASRENDPADPVGWKRAQIVAIVDAIRFEDQVPDNGALRVRYLGGFPLHFGASDSSL